MNSHCSLYNLINNSGDLLRTPLPGFTLLDIVLKSDNYDCVLFCLSENPVCVLISAMN